MWRAGRRIVYMDFLVFRYGSNGMSTQIYMNRRRQSIYIATVLMANYQPKINQD